LRLTSSRWIRLRLGYRPRKIDSIIIIRLPPEQEQLIYGSANISPARGWVSPTYNLKMPALSLALEVSDIPPFTLTSLWELPE
jgi:hypothetical protein